jgi:hypothetical protein
VSDMADFEELSFVIPGYTPETMPLNRLIEYLQQMSVVLGDPENLHLIEIREGSCVPTFHVPKAIALEAHDRAAKVSRGDGTKKQVDAYNRVSRMLRRDARDAGRPAVLRSPRKILLEIPVAPDDLGVLSGVRQSSTVDGQLIRVGGAGDDATLQVQDLDGRIMSGFTAKRTLAKELARLMWEPVRLAGIGQWGRSDEGTWSLERMQVQSYERLEEEALGVTLEKLRSANVVWPDDAYDKMLAEREATL